MEGRKEGWRGGRIEGRVSTEELQDKGGEGWREGRKAF